MAILSMLICGRTVYTDAYIISLQLSTFCTLISEQKCSKILFFAECEYKVSIIGLCSGHISQLREVIPHIKGSFSTQHSIGNICDSRDPGCSLMDFFLWCNYL